MNKEGSTNESAENFAALIEDLCNHYKRHDSGSSRLVVIVGAGVSVSSGMPLWNSMRGPIIAKAAEEFPRFLDEAERLLAPSIGYRPNSENQREWLLKHASTDAIASIACSYEVIGDAVRDLLCEHYDIGRGGVGPPPRLAHELLAHFLKHRIIDHIITFNFDPLLDAAVAAELAPSEYETIVSGDHITQTPAAEVSRIVKLHGTIRQPMTLRFTMRQTELLTPGMIAILDELIGIRHPIRARTPSKPSDDGVHLISLGYSWRDVGFREWAFSRSEYLNKVTIIQRGTDRAEEQIAQGFQKDAQTQTQVRFVYTDDLTHEDNKQTTIDTLLWALWNSLEDKFSAQLEFIMPASRHILLGYWFGLHGESELVPRNEHTSESRFKAELLLHLVKCKGMINIRAMARDLRLSRLRPMILEHVLDRSRWIGRNNYTGVNDTYFAKVEAQARSSKTSEPKKTINPKDERQLLQHFVAEFHAKEISEPFFDGQRVRSTPFTLEKWYEKHISKKIFGAPEVEVVRGCAPSTHWLFVNARPLRTLGELRDKSRAILSQPWTHLMLVAETAEWLTKDDILPLLQAAPTQRTVFLIRASLYSLDQWRLGRKLQKSAQSALRELTKKTTTYYSDIPWWQHNRHLTLAYDQAAHKFVGGIYFRRRGKAVQIDPVFIDDEIDTLELFNTYLAYVCRCCEQETKSTSPQSMTGKLARKSVDVAIDILQFLTERSREHPAAEATDRLHRRVSVLLNRRSAKTVAPASKNTGTKKTSAEKRRTSAAQNKTGKRKAKTSPGSRTTKRQVKKTGK